MNNLMNSLKLMETQTKALITEKEHNINIIKEKDDRENKLQN
jgi:hypothetical protein